MRPFTGLHRKSLTRLIGGPLAREPRRRQRGPIHVPEAESALCIMAESADGLHRCDCICAERLTPNLIWLAEHLDAQSELYLSPSLLTKLRRISTSTMRRSLSRHRFRTRRLPRKPPSPPSPSPGTSP
jgi:hypothetical protein